MFILRFIGRILSIGFILFIMLILGGKNARANGTWTAGDAAVENSVTSGIESEAGSANLPGISG